ncbi:aspartyl-phosphate phosphatase Spo0E family protein [Metabacillus bambusae]|uniref:Aspartyl-phosphate phosphatase Spo0E family protein n=1 Tax=Metabacillus bambusae TaxID=2795218 RepID=A0ABS3N036_9BACI|nr:aspartyl-phosphate phosphatase Spo0E family protein [Metabacillus bambusae]MBO1511420.1 aspartyl-phosphate phosphatase Spo0E family protein [Metabacillus bambusae]
MDNLNYELDLIVKIDNLRSKMLLVANDKGLRHPETIFLSTKLDNLILNYQKIKKGYEVSNQI